MTVFSQDINMTDQTKFETSNSPFAFNDSIMIDDFDIRDLGSSYNSKLNKIEENLISTIFSIVIILGIFGNLLVIWTVLFNKNMRTTSNIFILNLAISDLTLCFFSIPFNVYKTLRHTWMFGEFLCRLAPFFQASNVFVSSMSITAIALDRYIRIVCAVKIRQTNSLLRSYGTFLIIVFIWLFAFILSSPLFLFIQLQTLTIKFGIDFSNKILVNVKTNAVIDSSFNNSNILQPPTELFQPNEKNNGLSTYEIYHCVENWPYHQSRVIYSFMSLLLQYIMPILIVGIAYGSIWCKLNKQRNKLKSHTRIKKKKNVENSIDDNPNVTKNKKSPIKILQQNASQKCSAPKTKIHSTAKHEVNRRRKMNVLLSCIALIFATSWLPLNVFNILSDSKIEGIEATHTYFFVNALCILLGMSSAVSNPILYGVLNENFKREYAKVFSNFFSRILICFRHTGGSNNIINNKTTELVNYNADINKINKNKTNKDNVAIPLVISEENLLLSHEIKYENDCVTINLQNDKKE